MLSGKRTKMVTTVGILNSVQLGFLPVPLADAPACSFAGMPVHLRTHGAFESVTTGDGLTAAARVAMLNCGEAVVYIRMRDHSRFAEQSRLAEASAIIYGTSLALAREMEEGLGIGVAGYISRAITMFVLEDQCAFAHLSAVAKHDFYTATHMVNVAVGMTALARALGYADPVELALVCQAGLLHDMGKVRIPPKILNEGRLTDEEWDAIKMHPQHGLDILTEQDGVHSFIAARVVIEHHERADGSGYPSGLRGEDIHPVSMMCAVVDSFDAMTAMRPFKDRAMTPGQATDELEACTPAKYDRAITEAWLSLVGER